MQSLSFPISKKVVKIARTSFGAKCKTKKKRTEGNEERKDPFESMSISGVAWRARATLPVHAVQQQVQCSAAETEHAAAPRPTSVGCEEQSRAESGAG